MDYHRLSRILDQIKQDLTYPHLFLPYPHPWRCGYVEKRCGYVYIDDIRCGYVEKRCRYVYTYPHLFLTIATEK